ncbi:hypothetical protein P154DRAFT_56529 [Amniculicola lignicola CBS 123094]|uniref:Zn(2)-C6 fungal-type domain-containing protein n=1 Tax=Amniculicola lignicola CBS 123094 TaxID=1392246 RepID=A0A6A5WRM4_9PLEO|nr:hypothetical protein P154DRAFT_56529 [Amniculicola lignicola CBS 123094]
MPRLGHKKSRNGCRQCKARHVKCDENKPCSNCARHSVACSLVAWDPNGPSPMPARVESSSSGRVVNTLSDRTRRTTNATPPLSNLVPIEDILNPTQEPTPVSSEAGSPNTDPYPFLARFVDQPEPAQQDLWVRDLELMHHWTVDSHDTISIREDISDMWRLEAPKSGIHYRFLMHQMLAFTAHHLAYLNPKSRRMYHSLGIHHQDMALKDLRPQLSEITPENAGPLFSTSALITMSVFGSKTLDFLEQPSMTPPVFDELLDIFLLMRGMSSVLSTSATYTLQSPFRPILLDSPVAVSRRPIFEDLWRLIAPLELFIEAHVLEENARTQCQHSMAEFKNIVGFCTTTYADNQELRFLVYWTIQITPDFLNMIRQRDSAALAIISLYAVVLHAAQPIYWFMNGWSQRVMRSILDVIDPIWVQAIQWQTDFILGTSPEKQKQQQHDPVPKVEQGLGQGRDDTML